MAGQGDTDADAERGITRIGVENFKSIVGRIELDIRPLTILSGRNSSGKSSFMQPLLLLKQTLEAPYDPGALLLSGPNVSFSRVEQVFPVGRLKELLKVNIFSGGEFGMAWEFGVSDDDPIKLFSMERLGSKGIRLLNKKNDIGSSISFDDEDRGKIYSQLIKFIKHCSVVRERCILDIRFGSDDEYLDSLDVRGSKYRSQALYSALAGGANAAALLTDIIHVPGLRGNPEREYNSSRTYKKFPGAFNDYVAGIVQKAASDHHFELLLANSLEAIGLTWKVDARRVDDVRVEIRVARLPARRDDPDPDMVNIADVGFGVSQCLPVVVALLVAKPGQLVYIEQPELHLHPKAQVELAKLLVTAARRGVRVVTETHSHLLILGVQSAIAEDAIPASDVALYWFSRDEETGATRATAADLDETGAFGDWPADFIDVELEAQARYMDLVERKLARVRSR